MTKILMVCLGNICRSPLAHGILQSKLSSNKFYVDSAGTAGFHIGELPDRRSILVAKKYNIDITTQKARQFEVSDFDTFDLIYVMDESNLYNIMKLSRNENDSSKVKLILSEITTSSFAEVPDPYYGGDNGFENVYKMLDEACDVIAKKLSVL